MSRPDEIVQRPETTEFNGKLSKLAHVLPHVDLRVLTIYLQNTDTEVTAIEQYLEDERNGGVRHK